MTYTRQRSSLALTAALLVLCTSSRAFSSSHREAPFITELPKLDGTDFYMFRSYETGRDDFVTLIANYLPLQDPYGGPNYFSLDSDAVYEIRVDNDGDAQEDVTFQFRFANRLRDIRVPVGDRMVAVPLINVGAVDERADPNLNLVEAFSVRVIRGRVRDTVSSKSQAKGELIINADTGESEFIKPTDNIGQKSVPDYDAYARAHVYSVAIPDCGGGRLFVGQRKDPFVVNLGETFDLVNITNPIGSEDAEADDLADKNVTSLILEVPIDCLVDDDPVIGGWTTARFASSTKDSEDDNGRDHDSGGRGKSIRVKQVSRLGMPLVNEVVIGLKDKDGFNASPPKKDAQFGTYVTHPTVPELLEILFPVEAPNLFPRADLVATFLTGIEGLNRPDGVRPSEMLRLNTAIEPTDAASQDRLGVIGSDLAGFPNGRRPGDDVVDVVLRVAMGRLISLGLFGNPADAPSGNIDFTDGAFVDASFFDSGFPYLRTPLAGSPNATP